MFAVIETGGKQYRVEPGQVLDVELVPVEAAAKPAAKAKGKSSDPANKSAKSKKAAAEAEPVKNFVSFDRVLMIYGEGGTRVGNPTIPGARVEAQALREVRGKKELIFKHKKRKGYKRRAGHRQDYLRVRVEKIVV